MSVVIWKPVKCCVLSFSSDRIARASRIQLLPQCFLGERGAGSTRKLTAHVLAIVLPYPLCSVCIAIIMLSIDIAMGGTDELELPPRKKPKISELPLSSAQRASIDGILHTFKKKGDFDTIRKKTFQHYSEGAVRGMFEQALRKFTSTEIENNAIKYLKPDRRLAAPLLEGAAARSDVYDSSEADIDTYLDSCVAAAEQTLREIRRKEVSDGVAHEEQARGAKSEEEYAAEAGVRSEERKQKHIENEKLRLKKEAQERKRKQIEELKKKQEALQRETERLQRDQKRRLERDEFKRLEKERERERLQKFNEEREKAAKEAEERKKAAQAEQERLEKERREREQKRLEEEALNRLLKEGREREERTRRPDTDRAEGFDASGRARGLTSRNASSRDDMRGYGPSARSDRRRSRSPATRERREDDDRRSRRAGSKERFREGTMRKESYYRDISAERAAWKARQRTTERGEDGEVMDIAARARSRSKDSRRHGLSRSPANRTRDRSREHRDRSPRRRERSRSPPDIDRYVPSNTTSSRRARDASRDHDRTTRRDRSRDRRDYSRDRRDRTRSRGDDGKDRERREERTSRYDDRPRAADIDRYVPGSPPRRRDRSRSTDRRRDRSRDSYRERARESSRRDRDTDRK